MNASTVLAMARGKGRTVPIKLLSSAGTGFFYTTRKNISQTPEKFAFVKYDPVVKRRVLFNEAKIK
jgi:large subunit ribosomal protein L33